MASGDRRLRWTGTPKFCKILPEPHIAQIATCEMLSRKVHACRPGGVPSFSWKGTFKDVGQSASDLKHRVTICCRSGYGMCGGLHAFTCWMSSRQTRQPPLHRDLPGAAGNVAVFADMLFIVLTFMPSSSLLCLCFVKAVVKHFHSSLCHLLSCKER